MFMGSLGRYCLFCIHSESNLQLVGELYITVEPGTDRTDRATISVNIIKRIINFHSGE